MEVLVIASSSTDAGIGCWELKTGTEQMRYKSCASPPHGLTAVGHRFLAASQVRDPSASSGSVLYWSWAKPQVEVKSFPAEPIKPLIANSEGTYIVGGSSSGYIYLWEVASGRLLKKWHAHYRSVTCLVFSGDDSLLVSGAEDGTIRVWSLIRLFNEFQRHQGDHLYVHGFTEHTLPVTDIVMGYGGSNAIIISASEDRTCKVWSLSKGILMRSIVFPSAIDAIAMDPGESVFYAGSRDGKIYIGALNAPSTPSTNYGKHILGSLSDHSKGVTCLTYSTEGNLLLCGSEDGMVRVWDPKTLSIVRVFRHGKGPVNNIRIVTRPASDLCFSIKSLNSSRKHGLPPALEKYENSTDDVINDGVIVSLPACNVSFDTSYLTSCLINDQIRELQKTGSASTEMEMERMKLEHRSLMQMQKEWKKKFETLLPLCFNEQLDKDQTSGSF